MHAQRWVLLGGIPTTPTERADRAVNVVPHTYNDEWLIERHGYRTPRES